MTRTTPGLDRLTETARTALLHFLEHPDELVRDVDSEPTRAWVRASLQQQTPALPAAVNYLQQDSLAARGIPSLHGVNRKHTRFHQVEDKGRRQADALYEVREAATPAVTEVGDDLAANLFALVLGVDEFICGIVHPLLRLYLRAELGMVLLELWEVDDEAFDADAPGNELEYTDDEGLPTECDTPHNHLADLIVEAVTARLFKRHGVELLLAWTTAVDRVKAESA